MLFERDLLKKQPLFVEKTGFAYRYGFNGMESDPEVKGEGNSYDFGARMFDARVGRFLSLDPKSSVFPDLSPYVNSANSPIYYIDENGEGPIHPWKGTSLTQTYFSVMDWEVLAYDTKHMKNKANFDKNLKTAAWWARKDYEDASSMALNTSSYDTRDFGGQTYQTKMMSNQTELYEYTGNILEYATSEKNANYEGNFVKLETAAMSGNYVFGEELELVGVYNITTVKHNWITDEASFKKEEDGTWQIQTKTHYDVTGERTESRYGTNMNGETTNYSVKVFDVKRTITNYNNDGTSTTSTDTKTIEF